MAPSPGIGTAQLYRPESGHAALLDELFLAGDFQPGFGAVQRVERALDVDVGVAARQPLLGALFGFARARHVNFRRTLRRLRQNRHFVRQHFRESPGHGQPLLDRNSRGT